MKLPPERLNSTLEKNVAGPLVPQWYYCSGSDTFLVNEMADKIIAAAKKNGFTEISHLYVDSSFSWEKLYETIHTPSLFSPKIALVIQLPNWKLDDKAKTHKTKTYRRLTLSIEQFIALFIQHIPDLNFRMIRYYGFLSNRTRGTLLPIVYALIEQEKNEYSKLPTYAELIQKNFGFNPLICILCGAPLLLAGIHFGKTNVYQLLQHHRELALTKNCD